jgi:hypothetical protein
MRNRVFSHNYNLPEDTTQLAAWSFIEFCRPGDVMAGGMAIQLHIYIQTRKNPGQEAYKAMTVDRR